MTTLNRNIPPTIQNIDQISITSPRILTLSNGIPVHIIEGGTEEVTRVDLVIHSGTIHQEKPLQATFTNAMLRNSTVRYTQRELNEKLDYYGAWLQAGVQHPVSVISLYTLHKYFAETVDLLTSMLLEPLFLAEELEVLARTRKQQFVVSSQRVSTMAYRELCKQVFGKNHACGRIAGIEDFDLISTIDLKRFHTAHYHSGNCSIYLSGNIKEELLEILEEKLGKAVWGTPAPRLSCETGIPMPIGEKRVHLHKPDAQQSAVFLGMLTIEDKHPDYTLLNMATTVLGGYFGSRLMSNIREEKGYTYGIGAFMQSYPQENLWVISAETDHQHVEPLIKEVYYEMDRMREELVPMEEFNMVRNYLMGTTLRLCENAFSLSETYLSNDLSGVGTDFISQQIRILQEATPQDFLRIAQKYFCKEKLIEVIAGEK